MLPKTSSKSLVLKSTYAHFQTATKHSILYLLYLDTETYIWDINPLPVLYRDVPVDFHKELVSDIILEPTQGKSHTSASTVDGPLPLKGTRLTTNVDTQS